ncbi:MAG: ROK family protein [Calditrichaeota bacterium]|nr:MAG: ROK family protein [Calditrichota bacterium]MBL1207332.1 ROK family protein [Calditrichota bacterium]NOG47165.1 ROK family protein [Calditrichota bacterium]
MKSELLWGLDLGGTKIESVVLDKSSKKVLARERIPTEAAKGYHHILNQITKLVELTSKKINSTPQTIGIGMPGALDSQNKMVKNSNTVCLNNQPLKNDLEKMLGFPIVMANDANCFALAETKMGIVPQIYPEAQVVFGVIIGTGVSGGIVVNGKIINGRHGIAGEWGHNFLDESSGPCYCGQFGCVENIISGPALEKFYYDLSGKKKYLPEIVKLIKKDDKATQTINRLNEMFGKGVAAVINILDPDVIIIGGGVGNIDSLYDEGRDHIKKYLFNDCLDTLIVKPKLGDSAGVFGAAMLAD